MKIWKKAMSVLLAATLAGAMAIPAFAAETRTKLEEVSLSFSATDDEDEYGTVDVTSNTGEVSVDDVEFVSSSTSTSYPKVKVYLTADDDFYFSSTSKSLFTFDGEGATYSSASTRNSKQECILTVQLKKYSGATADVAEGLEWDYTGFGNWDEITNAGYYEVRLKRNGTVISEILKVDDTTFNFSNLITQTGNYIFQVRTVNQYVTSNKSKWVSSERWSVGTDELNTVRNTAAGGVNNNYYNGSSSSGSTGSSGSVSSGSNGVTYTPVNSPANAAGGWVQDSVGFWWKNPDGSWPSNCWMQLNGAWYFFLPSGYVAMNQWLQSSSGYYYYVGSDAKMMTNTRTPDGYYVNASGVWVPGA